MCYADFMSPNVKDILRKVESWPEEDQVELADLARDIEARRTGVYRLSDEEREAIKLGLADAQAGRFASDQEIDAIFKKARAAGK
jgi:predicted transcriptional regulator